MKEKECNQLVNKKIKQQQEMKKKTIASCDTINQRNRFVTTIIRIEAIEGI